MSKTTSKRKCEATPPKLPYVRTPEDEALVSRIAKGNKPVSLVGKRRPSGAIAMSTSHPDPQVGSCQIMEAFGVSDSNLLNGLLLQLTQLACSDGEVDYAKLNSMVAYVRGIGPKDAVEAMHAIQMASVHVAMMNVANILKNSSQAGSQLDQFDSASAALNKLARTWNMQVETLKKHRSTGEQSIRVQHVNVAEGAQAIVGNGPVTLGGRGATPEKEHQPHGFEQTAPPGITHAPGTPMLSNVEAIRPALQSAGRPRLERVPVPRGEGRSS